MRKIKHLRQVWRFFVVASVWYNIVNLVRNNSKDEQSTAVPSETSITFSSGSSITVPPNPRKVKSSQIQELENFWKIRNQEGNAVRSSPNNSRFNPLKAPQSFPLILNNASVCKTSNPEAPVYLITIVHSARGNKERRQVIRDTWGSITSVNNLQLRTVFLLGSHQEASEAQRKTDEAILIEKNRHGDIVLGGFHDCYRNLTYKHLMGYKWVLEHCSNASFILKTDDDVSVDIKGLVEIIKSRHPQNAFLCNTMTGTGPTRSHCKQTAVVEEYPHDFYPTYCSGLAYVVSQDVIPKILDESSNTRFFWIDDVYITGMLREFAEDAPRLLSLNGKINFHTNATEVWGSYRETLVKPFVVFLVQGGEKFAQNMKFLWTAVNSAS